MVVVCCSWFSNILFTSSLVSTLWAKSTKAALARSAILFSLDSFDLRVNKLIPACINLPRISLNLSANFLVCSVSNILVASPCTTSVARIAPNSLSLVVAYFK